MPPRRVFVPLVSVCVVWSADALASPQDLFGYGPRPQSMAGTGAAHDVEYSAAHSNPAGLSGQRRRTFTLGFSGAGFSLDQDGASLSAERGAATVIGLGLPLPLGGALRNRLGVGLGFFTPTEVVVRGRVLGPDTPQFGLLPDRVQTVALQLGLGVDLGRGVQVGVGVMAMAGLTGNVLVTTDAAGRAGSRIDTQLVATYAPIVGVRWTRGPWALGLVWRDTLIARFRVVIEAPDLGVPLPPLDIAGVAQYDPAQVHLEGAWRRGPVTLAAGLTGKRWSAFPGTNSATTPASPAPPPPDFSDTVVPRVGAEWRMGWADGTALALRGGLFYEPSPARAPTAALQLLDNDRVALTAGVGLQARAAGSVLRADVYAQHHWLVRREGVGPNGGVTRFGGSVLAVGVTLGVSF